jgi:hypothetical protein
MSVLGEIKIVRGGKEFVLPASRKARALLIYADAQPSANGTHSSDQHDVTLSDSDSEEIAVGMAKLPKLAGSSGQALLGTATRRGRSLNLRLGCESH